MHPGKKAHSLNLPVWTARSAWPQHFAAQQHTEKRWSGEPRLVPGCVDCTQSLSFFLRPVYTCDFWCDFWCDFAYQTRLTLPCTNVFFSRSVAWIGKKVMTYYLKTPFFPIPANLTVFRRSVTRLKTRAGQAGAGFVRKSNWETGASEMHDRAWDWSELSLAPVSQLLWTRKERDCVQSTGCVIQRWAVNIRVPRVRPPVDL